MLEYSRHPKSETLQRNYPGYRPMQAFDQQSCRLKPGMTLPGEEKHETKAKPSVLKLWMIF